jgi:hypothetical protein
MLVCAWAAAPAALSAQSAIIFIFISVPWICYLIWHRQFFVTTTAVWKVTKVHSCSLQVMGFDACAHHFHCRSLSGHQAAFPLEWMSKVRTGWTNNTSSFIGENPYP